MSTRMILEIALGATRTKGMVCLRRSCSRNRLWLASARLAIKPMEGLATVSSELRSKSLYKGPDVCHIVCR